MQLNVMVGEKATSLESDLGVFNSFEAKLKIESTNPSYIGSKLLRVTYKL